MFSIMKMTHSQKHTNPPMWISIYSLAH